MRGGAGDELLARAIESHKKGDLGGCRALCEEILRGELNHLGALNLMGIVCYQQNQYAEAAGAFERAIGVGFRDADCFYNFGQALRNLGREQEAVGAYREATRVRADFAEAHFQMGKLLGELGQFEAAVRALQIVLRLKPEHFKASYEAGRALRRLGFLNEASNAFLRAIQIKGDYADAFFQLGCVQEQLGGRTRAAECWKRAIELDPKGTGSMVNLAALEIESGRLSQATEHLKQAEKLEPASAIVANNLGNAYSEQGKLDEAIAHYRRAMELEPGNHYAHSNLLLNLNHHPGVTPEELFEEHLRFARRYTEPLAGEIRGHSNSRDPSRRLRVGYVSADFKDNQVGFFITPLLAAHDREKFFVKCYCDLATGDALTEKMKGYVNEWQYTWNMGDEAFAEQVRGDAIDILVDLTVHAGRHRLLAFARRPAPVQMTYLGYPNTTGVAAVDYRITDVHLDPAGMTERFHAEKLIRLPETYFCYRGPEKSVEVGELPSAVAGYVTFGSFNRLMKLNAQVIELWAKVLRAVPGSKLYLKAAGLVDEEVRRGIWGRFGAIGIGAERVRLEKWDDFSGYLNAFNSVDIALDPFPFNGGTTTLHGFWMGVPVVTLAGKMAVGRMGVSLLNNVGLGELVAETEEEYVEKAVGLAGDRERLAGIRGTLRERLRRSPVMDARRFAGNVERGFRSAWRNWCEGKPARHLGSEDFIGV